MGGKEEGWIDYLPGETVMSIKKDNPRKPLSILPGNNKGSNKQVIICFHCRVLNLIKTKITDIGTYNLRREKLWPCWEGKNKAPPLAGDSRTLRVSLVYLGNTSQLL